MVVLNGKYAGKKAVIVKQYDDGADQRKYGFSIVAGVARCPKKVTKAMGKKKLARRSRVKPFIKILNNTHMMPTR